MTGLYNQSKSSQVGQLINYLCPVKVFLLFFIPGHEFIGRNSYPGALQLSVREMRDITTDVSCTEHAAGCMTVGPGVYWIEAYKAVSYPLLQAFS